MAHRIARAALVGAATTLVLALPAAAASASEASGCTGVATSFDSAGSAIDFVTVPGATGSQANPFRVDPNGYVIWRGTSTAPITGATYSVTALGLPILSGAASNPGATTSAGGVVGNRPSTVTTTNVAPIDLSGIRGWVLDGAMFFPVTGTITGTGGACTVTVWVGGAGSGTNTPLFWAGILAGIAGVALAAWTVQATRWEGVIDITTPRPAETFALPAEEAESVRLLGSRSPNTPDDEEIR